MVQDSPSPPQFHDNKLLILVPFGAKGSGKNSVADIVSNKFGLTTYSSQLSFAEPLKQLLWDNFGIYIKDRDMLWGNDTDKSKDIIGLPPIDEYLKKRFTFLKSRYWTGRLLLQYYGTEVFRFTHPDIWVDKMKASLDMAHKLSLPIISITDMRFPNEYNVLESLDSNKFIVKFIRIERPWLGAKQDPHVSESNWKQFKYDEIVFNDAKLDDLKNKVDSILHKLAEELK